jgi:hypothetical protein
MAGRGTDIKLGKDLDLAQPEAGLQIIGTERHESRRIDRQLRGPSRTRLPSIPGRAPISRRSQDRRVTDWRTSFSLTYDSLEWVTGEPRH